VEVALRHADLLRALTNQELGPMKTIEQIAAAVDLIRQS